VSELSIFIDESGDFGPYDYRSPYYIITMVFHDQAIDISAPMVSTPRRAEKNDTSLLLRLLWMCLPNRKPGRMDVSVKRVLLGRTNGIWSSPMNWAGICAMRRCTGISSGSSRSSASGIQDSTICDTHTP